MKPVGSVEDQLAAIRELDRDALVDRWRSMYGQAPPKGISRRLLERAAAYAVQAKAYGGLKPKTRKTLLRIADSGDETEAAQPRGSKPNLDSGTRLLREWNGRTHQVDVTEDGFAWNGETYRSLSAAARAITGARWSGPRFFGL
jgi:hypothetical protein